MLNFLKSIWYIHKFKFEKRFDRTDSGSAKLVLLIKCGIGDLYSYMARWDNLLNRYPGRNLMIYAGGHDNILTIMQTLFENDKRIKSFCMIRRFTSTRAKTHSVVFNHLRKIHPKEDMILNWICHDASLEYDMRIPFKLILPPEVMKRTDILLADCGLKKKNYITVHPVTLFGGDVREERYWEKKNWHELIRMLIQSNHKIILIGCKGEDAGIKPDNKNIFDLQGIPVDESIALISNSSAFIGTNSFTWEVAAYQMIPTICFFFTNLRWLPIHLPAEPSKVLPATCVFTERSVTPRQVYDKFRELILDI